MWTPFQNFFPAASFPKVNGKQSMTMTILDTPLRIVRSPISYSKDNFLHFHPEGGREGGKARDLEFQRRAPGPIKLQLDNYDRKLDTIEWHDRRE